MKNYNERLRNRSKDANVLRQSKQKVLRTHIVKKFKKKTFLDFSTLVYFRIDKSKHEKDFIKLCASFSSEVIKLFDAQCL